MSIGFHVSKTNIKKKTRKMSVALAEAVKDLEQYGFASFSAQIFVTGPQNYKQTVDDEDIKACARIIATKNIATVVHGAYVDYPWNNSAGAIHNIKQELRISHRLGARGVIVHLGAGASDDTTFGPILQEIANLSDDELASQILYLEVHAAKSSPNTYETTEKVRRLFERVAALNLPLRVGFCIDTAHLFSCGVSLDSYDRAQEWLDGLPDGVPIMLHLNDSASTLGSGKDAHAALCLGNLWGGFRRNADESGLAAILTWAEMNNIITILERDEDGISHDLNMIHGLGFFQ